MKASRLCAAVCLLIVGLSLNAQLIPNPDGNTVYDPTFEANWAANANLAGTTPGQFGLSNINPSGSMDFRTAKKFVDTLNGWNGPAPYLGHTTWQMPAFPNLDSTCDSTGPNGNNFGYGCKGSAMGYLYNVSFGFTFPNTAVPIPDMPTCGFHNFQPYLYWSNTQSANPTQGYHAFSFNNGFVGSNVDKHQMYALPMVPYKIAGHYTDTGCDGLQVSDDGKAVYDQVAGVTWAADANLAATKTFGTACDTQKHETFCINADGSMTHTLAEAWVANMSTHSYLGQTAWVLPEIPDSDSSCSLDLSFGFNCTGNLLGRLYYQRMKLLAGTPVVETPNINVSGFNNLQPYLYWGCTLAAGTVNLCNDQPPAAGFAWSFSFGNGFQGTDVVGNNLYVMVYYPETPAQALAEGINEYLGGTPELNSFLTQAPNISSSPNSNAKAGRLAAFVNHVNAERGSVLTNAQADYLIALAQVN